MPRLQDLPPELILMICRTVGSAAGLVGFSATCRQFYNVASAEMYILDAQEDRKFGPSALHWAAYRNDVDMARKALDTGAKPDQYWVSGYARIDVDAIMASPTAAVVQLDVAGQNFWTALHLAVARGNEEMVRLLLRYHASVDVFSSGFCSCLNTTITTRNRSLMERCELPSEEPWPLLHTAFCFGRDSIANLLALEGAAAYKCSSNRQSLLRDLKHSRSHHMHPDAALAMNMAAFYGCPKTLTYLMSLHPKLAINTRSGGRRTVLCHALFGEAPEIVVPLLINAGADINYDVKNGSGNKILWQTCWEGRFAAALLLLKHGADIECRHESPFITLLAACCRKATHAALEAQFSAHYAGAFWFRRTLHHDPLKPPTSWPICQVDKNVKARYEIVQLLLARGVDVEAVTGLYGEPKALYLAAECHLHDIVELLLSHGADVSTTNMFDNTALMAAISSGFADTPWQTIECLLRHGVDVNAQNSDGDTALHLLQRSRFQVGGIARLLLQNGASLHIANKAGNLPVIDQEYLRP